MANCSTSFDDIPLDCVSLIISHCDTSALKALSGLCKPVHKLVLESQTFKDYIVTP